jgi:hypothetical protein
MIAECESCSAFVEADEKGQYERFSDGSGPSVRFVLLQCNKCSSPLLVEQTNIGNLAIGDVWDTPTRLFPASRYRPNLNAPKNVQIAFAEACTCYRSRAYTATAILCRKTLEGICKVHGVNERSLISSLRKMKEDGVIDESLYEWSDALRNAGNEAAHDLDITVSEADATDIIEFTNAILDYLFSYRDRFQKFKSRREQR